MKRAFPQKVKPVYAEAVDKEEDLPKSSTYRVALLKQVLPEGNRRARTSAAMIGLAISMGASSLFLPRQGDGAMAAEPTAASPNASQALASLENGAFEPIAPVETAPAAISGPMPNGLQHNKSVQEEPTQWPVSQTEQVNATAIASDNGISSQPVLQSEAELQAPSYGSVSALETMVPLREPFQERAIEAAPSTLLAPFTSPVEHSAIDISPIDNVDRLFEAKQKVAANKKIKPLSNRLKNGLAEFGSEESTSSFQSITESAQPSTSVANPSASIGNLSAGAAQGVPSTPVGEPQAIAVPSWASLPVISSPRSIAIVPEAAETKALAPLSLPAPKSAGAIQLGGAATQRITPESVEAPALAPVGLPTSETAAPVRLGWPVRAGIIPEGLEAPVLAPPILPATDAATPSSLGGQVRAGIASQGLDAPTLAPVGLPTPETAAPKAVEESQAPTGTAETIVTPDLSQAIVINPEANQAAAAKIYRVNSGDTLGAIAQNYGIASTDLIKANRLSDPNLINIDQTLQIPLLYQPGRQEVQTTALIHNPKLSGTIATPELVVKQSQPEMPNLVLQQPTLTASTPSLTPGSPATSDSTSSVSISRSSETEESANRAVEPLIYTPSTANVPASLQSPVLQPETEYNSSVEGLRAEIYKLREKYRTQKASTAAGNATVSTVAEVADPTISDRQNSYPAALQSRQINPEFSPNQYAQTGQVEVQNRQPQQAEQIRSQTAVQASARELVSVGQLDQSGANQSIMATAPLGADNYEPLQPRMVSPELPPLASPDTYLPKGGATFAGFIWPAQGELTSGYGWRWGRMHKGIDIAAAIGTPVVAAAPGKVTYAQWNEGGYGNLVEITHPDGSTTLYAHNDRILVREGQEVEQGQQISEMGTTGFSTGPHLHFEVHTLAQGAVNPIALLPGSGGVSSEQ